MSDYDPTDEELEILAQEYIFGVNDFSDLPWTVGRVIPSPEDHPDHDPFESDFAGLQELAGRVRILLAAKLGSTQGFSFTFDGCGASIGDRTGREFGFAPGCGFWPGDPAADLLAAWRGEGEAAA